MRFTSFLNHKKRTSMFFRTLLSACLFAVTLLPAAYAADTIGPSGLPVPRFVALKADITYGRVGPSFDYPVLFELRRQGLPVKVIAETPDNVWRKVEDFDGTSMWIHRSQLVGADMVMVNASQPIVLRAKADVSANPRAMLEPGVLADLVTCQPEWCRVSAGAYKGWVPRSDLWGVMP